MIERVIGWFTQPRVTRLNMLWCMGLAYFAGVYDATIPGGLW